MRTPRSLPLVSVFERSDSTLHLQESYQWVSEVLQYFYIPSCPFGICSAFVQYNFKVVLWDLCRAGCWSAGHELTEAWQVFSAQEPYERAFHCKETSINLCLSTLLFCSVLNNKWVATDLVKKWSFNRLKFKAFSKISVKCAIRCLKKKREI